MVVSVPTAPPDFDRVFAALADHTRRDIVRRKVVRTNLEALRVARRLLDQYEELWRARIDRMHELIAETAGAIDSVETKESKR